MGKAKALTEEQWMKSNESYSLLRHLQQHCRITKAPDGLRRLRLWSCASCRLVWDLIKDERCRRAIEVMERAADAKASRQELAHARMEAGAADEAMRRIVVCSSYPGYSPISFRAEVAGFLGGFMQSTASLRLLGNYAHKMPSSISAIPGTNEELEKTDAKAQTHMLDYLQAQLVRDIFGNPFPPRPTVDPAWLGWNSGTAVRLAQMIYDERRFDGLPVLADALEEAGCTNAEILEHCRSKPLHARGCWVVDLLLGKS